MATRTITRMYDSHDEGVRAVTALENAGIAASDISIVSNSGQAQATTGDTATGTEAGTGAGTGATLGTVVGGGAGLLAGLGALAIPGIGPLVAAGWLVATLAGAGVGATAGGVIGSVTGAGVSHEDAHVYAEGIRRGGTLVTVRAEESDASRIEELLGLHPHVDVSTRGQTYRAEGWQKYDENAGPYNREGGPVPASEVTPITTVAPGTASTAGIVGLGASGATVPPIRRD